MNYIKQLQAEVESAKREVEAIKTGLGQLRNYLHSSKFACGDRLDGYVATGDVLAHLRNAEDSGIQAREFIGQ